MKNAVWLLGGEFFGRFIRAAIVIFGARFLGAAEYGAFAYAMAIAGFLTIFSDIGLGSVLTRESVKNPELRPKYFATAFAIKLWLILLNVALVIFVAPLITKIEAAKPLLIIIAAIIVFDSLREFGFGLNRALEKMEKEAYIKIATNSAIVLFGFWFLLRFQTAYSLSVAYMVGSGIGFLLTCLVLWSHVRELKGHFEKSLVRSILSTAWPIGLLAVLGAIMINTDMVMLGWWLPAEQVGYYAAAQKIIQLLYIFPTLLASAAFPIFTKLVANNPGRFQQVLTKIISASIAIALPIAIGGILLAPKLIHLLYGAAYLPAAATFGILLATILIVFPSVIVTNALFAFNAQKHFTSFVAIGALTNAFFNYLLIPRYGIEGAAIATIGSQLLSNAFVWYQMQRVQAFTLRRRLWRIVGAAIGMSLIVFILAKNGWPVLLVIASGALAYFGLLVIAREPLLKETLEAFKRVAH